MRLKNKFLSFIVVISLIFGVVDENQLECLAMSESSEIKTVFLGDTGVGKTSIIGRLVHGKFFSGPTINVGALIYVMTLKNGRKLSIWDTAGQEQFRSTIPMYLREAKIIILVFDLSRRDIEFVKRHLNNWCKTLENTDLDAHYIIVGNKLDLCKPIGEEVKAEFTKFAREHGIEKFLMCSALTGEGIDELKKNLTVLSSNFERDVRVHNSVNIESAENKICGV